LLLNTNNYRWQILVLYLDFLSSIWHLFEAVGLLYSAYESA
jgi:hypothetical protein